jgi:hypothetical protein
LNKLSPVHLRNSLHARARRTPLEFANGDTLQDVLTRDLSAIEAAANTDMLTSILLLEGRCLKHAAGPRLPLAYRAAIDGAEIGPCAGSCGTAAFFGRPIYVSDIANDRLWVDYREYALPHGLRACWSTPIFDDQAVVIGTFAIYHLMPRSPTPDEVEAIRAITDHVGRAILWSTSLPGSNPASRKVSAPQRGLRLIAENGRLLESSSVSATAGQVDDLAPYRAADSRSHPSLRIVVKILEAISRRIDRAIHEFGRLGSERADLEPLHRAKEATLKAAALARSALPADADRSD